MLGPKHGSLGQWPVRIFSIDAANISFVSNNFILVCLFCFFSTAQALGKNPNKIREG